MVTVLMTTESVEEEEEEEEEEEDELSTRWTKTVMVGLMPR